MKILILDDEKSRLQAFKQKLIGASVTCVEYVKDCIHELEFNGPFDYIMLDHDLDHKTYVPSGPGTGYEVAVWLKEHLTKKPAKIILHTCNEYGAAEMMKELPEAVHLPGLFLINFNVIDLDNIEKTYKKQVNTFET